MSRFSPDNRAYRPYIDPVVSPKQALRPIVSSLVAQHFSQGHLVVKRASGGIESSTLRMLQWVRLAFRDNYCRVSFLERRFRLVYELAFPLMWICRRLT
jgi:hypothetical protein